MVEQNQNLEQEKLEDKYGDFATVKVPEGKGKSFFGMFLVYTGVLVCVAVLYGGAELGYRATL